MNAGLDPKCSSLVREEEFRQSVRDDARGTVPERVLRVATDHFVEARLISRDHVEACIRLAKSFLEAAGLVAGPRIKVTERDLVDKIQPQVERLRRALFHTVGAPFKSMSEAAMWIERTAPSGGLPRLPRRARKQAENLMVDAQVRLQAYSELVGHEAVVHEIVRRLPYTKPGKRGLLYAPVRFNPRETKLGRLEGETRMLAEATGFPQESVVAYVLSGEAPRLPGVRLSTTYRRLGERGMPLKSVVTEMFSRDVTASELRRVHSVIRTAQNAVRVRPLTSTQEEVLELVRRLRAVRPAGELEKDFWERVRQEWNRRHPASPYKTWRPLEMRYRRLTGRRRSRGRPDGGAGGG